MVKNRDRFGYGAFFASARGRGDSFFSFLFSIFLLNHKLHDLNQEGVAWGGAGRGWGCFFSL